MTDLAASLASAWREHRALDPSAWTGAVTDAAKAYAVQDRVAQAMGWFGSAVPGHWKSGGPSRDAVLTHAPLPPAGVRASPANYGDMHFNAPGIESEIALRLGEDVTPERAATLTPEHATALIDAMTVSIEIVDSRWKDPAQATALLKLADQQSHGALVLGAWVPYAARDWTTQVCETRIGARGPDLRRGTHPMYDPAWLLPVWLRHVTRDGRAVPAGTVVTTGSWVGVLPAQKGDTVMVEFPGIGRAEARL
ncbi:fumarylacetoacetate hydrolase family protein [Variovorax sp. YR216]|uniref:fumarylacetoacetate hydrolase family protein n=1 Tax=Variovorax sp. YR216 TaxID=1882828 RepID=UPI00089B78D1|nr:fumarylacetoacetate hydrolase family protein [Variovorax sp. YR216]SEB24886.1 2-keto-4-pentenoate hydratase [Variovorax sp. YR216]